jgi:hypothetical protein
MRIAAIIGRKTHGDKCRTHIAEGQRAMLRVVGWRIDFESCECPLEALGGQGESL